MPRHVSTCAALTLALFTTSHLAAGDDGGPEPPLIEIVDESGEPVENAEYIYFGSSSANFWFADGWHPVSDNPRLPSEVIGATSLTVHAVAPDLAWASATLNPQEHDGPVRLTLTEGHPITFTIKPPEGRELPDSFSPVIFDPARCVSIAFAASHDNAGGASENASLRRTPANAVRTGERTFEARVPENAETVSLLIDEPGFLRAFSAMDLPIAEAPFTIDLPEPATLDVNIQPAETRPAVYDKARYRVAHTYRCEMPIRVHLTDEQANERSISRRHDDLAPGQYTLYAMSGTKGEPDYYKSNHFYTLEPGETRTVELEISTFDESYWMEKWTETAALRLTFKRGNETPAGGASYRLVKEFTSYDTSIDLFAGRANDKGIAHIPNYPLTGAALYVNGSKAGYVIPDKARRLDDGTLAYEFTVKGTPTGAIAPNLAMRDVRTGEAHSLRQFRGKVVLLDMWASWCGPCQPVMKKNNRLVQRRDDWAGDVLIIGASIDEKIETIRQHLDNQDWYDIRQMHVTRNDDGKLPPAYRAFGNRFIPHAVLIDRAGRIVKQGHPDSFNAEEAIEELLTNNNRARQ